MLPACFNADDSLCQWTRQQAARETPPRSDVGALISTDLLIPIHSEGTNQSGFNSSCRCIIAEDLLEEGDVNRSDIAGFLMSIADRLPSFSFAFVRCDGFLAL